MGALSQIVFQDLSSNDMYVSKWDFVEAATMNDAISMTDMVAMIDVDRRRPCLERVFYDNRSVSHVIDNKRTKARFRASRNPTESGDIVMEEEGELSVAISSWLDGEDILSPRSVKTKNESIDSCSV